jgi:hypothetical protein
MSRTFLHLSGLCARVDIGCHSRIVDTGPGAAVGRFNQIIAQMAAAMPQEPAAARRASSIGPLARGGGRKGFASS